MTWQRFALVLFLFVSFAATLRRIVEDTDEPLVVGVAGGLATAVYLGLIYAAATV